MEILKYPIWFYAGLALAISLLVFLIVLVILKKRHVAVYIALAVDVLVIAGFIIFEMSHATYYKYNDWEIVNSDIQEIKEKYGEFDIFDANDEGNGEAAYYVYTDNGFVMHNHIPYYYYMKFDENGKIYEVRVDTPRGG